MIAQGPPYELATAVHAALGRRRSGARFAVVLKDRDTVELVETETKKLDRIERDRSNTIAGYYIGHMGQRGKITIDELYDAIAETIKGLGR